MAAYRACQAGPGRLALGSRATSVGWASGIVWRRRRWLIGWVAARSCWWARLVADWRGGPDRR